MLNTAIILAGGFGTRLKSLVSNIPKPMAMVNNQPFLNYLINYLKHYQIKNIVFSTGYLSDVIELHYKTSFENLNINYSIENEPLGTGGGIRKALELINEQHVLVLNGDSFFDVNLIDLYNQYNTNQYNAIIATRKVDNADRYGTIETKNQIITNFIEKTGIAKPGIINGGVYILNKNHFINNSANNINFSIEKNYFEKYFKSSIFGAHTCDGYFIDIGIPTDFLKAQNEFKNFKY